MKSLHQQKSLENQRQLSGQTAPSRAQVFFCLGEFRRGRRSFDDEHLCGTPATAVMVSNIAAAKNIIRAEPRVSTREIQKSLSIQTAAIMSILHDLLRVRKQRTKWIPTR